MTVGEAIERLQRLNSTEPLIVVLANKDAMEGVTFGITEIDELGGKPDRNGVVVRI